MLRSARAVLILLVLTPALCGVTIAGCRRTAEKPRPEPRFRTLGPKEGLAPYFKGTILETVDVHGIQNERVSGYGVVANLENTGNSDGIPTAVREHVLRMAQILGIGREHTEGPMGDLSATQFLADPRTAVVRVEGIVPPGARAGDRIDVVVKALETNTTTSLARGELYQTELHSGLVTPQSPGERVNLVGMARGRLMVNPVYALEDPTYVKDDPAARESLRIGYIPDGAIFHGDRTILLRLREPSFRTARAIEHRINMHFGTKVAAAQNEGVVALAIPDGFDGDWPHFVGLATTLFFYGINKGYAVERANELVAVAQDPSLDPANLEGISYAWEGLGSVASASVLPLFSHPNPAVAFWAARAMAFNREPAAVEALLAIAADEDNPFAVRAALTLGQLPRNTSLIRDVRTLLDASSPDVRIAAYRSLLRLRDDTYVQQVAIGDGTRKQFYLDLVPAKGRTIITATRTGTPRIAIIGPRPHFRTPMLVTAFRDRLSIHLDGPQRPVNVYYRPMNDIVTSAVLVPELPELVARLGGETPPGELPIRLCYGDVVAVLKHITDAGQVVGADGQPAALVLEDVSSGLLDEAPIIPGLEDLQAVSPGQAPRNGGNSAATRPSVSSAGG